MEDESLGQDLTSVDTTSCQEGKDITLFQLICHGKKEEVNSFLSSGVEVNVNVCDKNGKTPLMLSSLLGYEDIVELVLNQGADVNVCDEKGQTALMFACKIAHVNIVKELLKNGSDVDTRDECGATALWFAIWHGHSNKYFERSRRRKDLAVNTLCESRIENVVKLLLDGGADAGGKNMYGPSVLAYTSKFGPKNLMNLFNEHGANVITADVHVLTSAHWIGDAKCVNSLIEHGANINAQDERGNTALMNACKIGNQAIVMMLVNHGADINVQDAFGRTALMKAVERGRDTIVQMLLEKAVDVNMKDKFGITALMRACTFDYVTFVNFRKRRTCIRHMRMAHLLLRHGADTEPRDKETGRSAVMMALENGMVGCLQELLPHHPNLDTIDTKGETVFSLALNMKRMCMDLLLVEGRLLTNGRLRLVHESLNNACRRYDLTSILATIEAGVFEWKWCYWKYFREVTLAALYHGFCPGKFKRPFGIRSQSASPLIESFEYNNKELIHTILKHLYYFPEDYVTLVTDEDIRKRVQNADILDKITLQPGSLQTWSFLTVSKSISLAGPPGLRHERVNSLPIPDFFKRKLNFKIHPHTQYLKYVGRNR